MENLKVATAQFENRSNDKAYNLSVMENMARSAANEGVKIISFHECAVSGYSFARNLSKDELLEVAEFVPEGESITALQKIAAKCDIVVLAGLYEKDEDDKLYNTYVCLDKNGLVAKFRKLHPFINPHLSPGNEYCVFELFGWKCGILICYDNNIPENVRATKLLGADIIFMPHVTMCTPSTRPGAGFINPKLWHNREADPTSLKLEFEGMKGRKWLIKWLPARAYDNAAYVIFSNPIGMDDDQLKNGCSMIVDPFGDILSECKELGDCYITATLTLNKVTLAGGHRYMKARRPDLYRELFNTDHISEQKVTWITNNDKDEN